MTFLHFQSFIVTADRKSITAAAKELYITPTSLLQQLNLLEADLGFKVFNRSRKGVTLTRAGERLYEGCKVLMDENEALLKECRSIADQDENLVRISLARPYHLMEISKKYTSEKHIVKFEFDRIDPLTLSNTAQQFTKAGFDMVQVCYNPHELHNYSYEIIPYPADRLCCVCSTDHPLSKKASISLEELDGFSLEIFSNFPYSPDLLEAEIARRLLSIPVKRALFSERAVLKCCANNDIYVLEEQAARTFSYLSVIPIEPAIPCYIGLAYMKNAKPAVQRFAQYVREHMDVIAAQYE